MSLRDYKSMAGLVSRISDSILSSHLSHAYIIEGDSGIDKKAFAMDFVKAVLCKEDPGFGCDHCATCRQIEHDNYADLYYVCSDGRSVKDAAVSNMQNQLFSKPVEGDRNVAIIDDADTMTIRAQNRLLKTLEEPNPGTIIILLSENTDNLLDTVRSRSVIYRLGGSADRKKTAMDTAAEDLMNKAFAGEYFYDLSALIDKKVKDKDKAAEMLDSMERLCGNYLRDITASPVSRQELAECVSCIEEARRDLTTYNVGYKYVMKRLILRIGR
jgi:DNA polymerase III, gamma/tau subunits